MDRVKDILDEIHPLPLGDEDDENYDVDEENRMVHQLEEMQKKALAKPMNRDEEEENAVEAMDNDSDEEELNIAPDSFERVGNSANASRHVDNRKFDRLWSEFEKKLIRESTVNAQQVQ